MATLNEYLQKQNTWNSRHNAAIDSLVSSVDGVKGDVEALNKKIEELQNSSGGVTPEDQALIDQLESAGDALATKMEGVAGSLKTLDEQTPPVVPPAPPA